MPADTYLSGEGPLCDGCFDTRIAVLTGMPLLPEVPGPIVITDSEGRPRRMHHRMRRVPTGIALDLREDGVEPGEGYEFSVLGDDDADLGFLTAAVRARAEAEMSRRYLEPSPHGVGWTAAGDEIAGRLECEPDGGPYRAVVDGRSISWAELGEALEPFEGWGFRLTIEERIADVRSDADVIAFPTQRGDAG